ncbi:6258_t:CDS:2, partial [Racocetra fulgida]
MYKPTQATLASIYPFTTVIPILSIIVSLETGIHCDEGTGEILS